LGIQKRGDSGRLACHPRVDGRTLLGPKKKEILKSQEFKSIGWAVRKKKGKDRLCWCKVERNPKKKNPLTQNGNKCTWGKKGVA